MRRKAQTEATKSKQVAQFLKDMIAAAGPAVARGRDTTLLREILDKAAERVGKDLKDQPEVEAELRSVIGDAYFEISNGPQAVAMHREALAIYRRLLGDEDRQVASSLQTIGYELSEFREKTPRGIVTSRGDCHVEKTGNRRESELAGSPWGHGSRVSEAR